MTEPDFTIGVEEEYLLVDIKTRALAVVPDAVMDDCKAALGEENAGILHCVSNLGDLREILTGGTSSDRQRAVYATTDGDNTAKMNAVVDHPIEEFSMDL